MYSTPRYQPAQRALVMGDNLSGLLAAQALTRLFQQVVVIEQPPVAGPPPVIKAPCLLNGRTQQALDELFPGLLAELETIGGVRFNLGLHVAWSVNGRWRPRYRSAYDLLVCPSSLLLEAIRRRLERETTISFQPITRLPPAELTVEIDRHPQPALLAGAGRLFQGPGERPSGWQMLVVEPDGPARRGAVILPLAAGQFYLMLWGTAVDPPPSDETGFMAFAQALSNPIIDEITARAQPVSAIESLLTTSWPVGPPSPPAGLARLPSPGYLPNPLLGQPVDYALAGRAALVDSLSNGELGELNDRLRHNVSHQLRPLNLLAQAETHRWAGMTNKDSGDLDLYLSRVTDISLNSATVLEALYAVQQGLEPLSRLFQPDVVLQTIG
jgi:hypothetical protein